MYPNIGASADMDGYQYAEGAGDSGSLSLGFENLLGTFPSVRAGGKEEAYGS